MQMLQQRQVPASASAGAGGWPHGRENKRRAKTAHNVGLSEYEKTELGDLNPEFKYMY